VLPFSAVKNSLQYVHINVTDVCDVDQLTDDARLTNSIEPGSILVTHLIKKFPLFMEAHGPL
jgi:hypothetical protein